MVCFSIAQKKPGGVCAAWLSIFAISDYGPGFGDGAGWVGLAFGEDGVVTGWVIVEAPVFVTSRVAGPRP